MPILTFLTETWSKEQGKKDFWVNGSKEFWSSSKADLMAKCQDVIQIFFHFSDQQIRNIKVLRSIPEWLLKATIYETQNGMVPIVSQWATILILRLSTVYLYSSMIKVITFIFSFYYSCSDHIYFINQMVNLKDLIVLFIISTTAKLCEIIWE